MASAGDLPRHERIALNESKFREINERLRSALDQLPRAPEMMECVCECGRRECGDAITLSASDYERVRADPTHFAVVPGHEMLEAERVVERASGHLVVEKHADVAELARERDPRG